MSFFKWSTTANDNDDADSTINWAEGQAPSSVNNSSRAMMAASAKYRIDQAGTLTTGGTSTAYTITSNQVFDSLANMSGQSIRIKMHAANGASPTLNVDGLGAKAIVTVTGTAVGTGALLINTIYGLVYSNSSSEWILLGGSSPLAGFATGTVMLFVQTAAPTGWTKGTTHNDKALRLVTGTAGTGGSTAFTTVLASRTIAQGNLPNFNLNLGSLSIATGVGGPINGRASSAIGATSELLFSNGSGSLQSTTNHTLTVNSSAVGGTLASGGSGTAMDFAVSYVDVILGTKD